MAKQLRIGVIGLGWAGTEHLKGYRTLPNVEIAALCDLKTGLLAEKAKEFGVRQTFTSYRKMLAEAGLDAVSVCVPNDVHAPATRAALKAGKHVLCEKPPARNAREAQAMADAAKKAGRVLMYAVCLRFTNAARTVKAFAESGDLGEIYFARAVYHRRRGIPMGERGWFLEKSRAGGGALADIGVHALDTAWWVMGCPRPVTVSGATYSKFTHTVPKGVKFDVEDSAFALIKFANGATLILETSWALNQRGGSVTQIAGTRGGAEFHPLVIFTERDGVQMDVTPQLAPDNIYADEVGHFAECIERRREPISPAGHGVLLMKMLDGLYESSRRGREVRIRY